eukprot:scaffold44496_cov41-Prasinocladus_malaysianus.AAC.1
MRSVSSFKTYFALFVPADPPQVLECQITLRWGEVALGFIDMCDGLFAHHVEQRAMCQLQRDMGEQCCGGPPRPSTKAGQDRPAID